MWLGQLGWISTVVGLDSAFFVGFRLATYCEPACSCSYPKFVYSLIYFIFYILRISYAIRVSSVCRTPLYLSLSYLYSMYLPRLPSVICLPNRRGELVTCSTLSLTYIVPSRYHLGTSIISRLPTKPLSCYHLDSYRLWAPRPALKTRYTTVNLESLRSYHVYCSYLSVRYPSILCSQA